MDRQTGALALCVALLVFPSTSACKSTGPLAPPTESTQAIEAEPRIDPDRMFAVLEHLASDALAGRYSLSESHIRAAATYLAQAYREAGIPAVGPDYLLEFPLSAGSERSDDYHFWIEREGASERVDDDAFVTLGTSDASSVVAEVVLVDPSDMRRLEKPLRGAVALIWPSSSGAPTTEQLVSVASAEPAAIIAVHDGELPQKNASLVSGVAAIALQRNKAREAFGLDSGDARVVARTKVSLAPKPREIFRPVPNVLASIPGTDRASEIVVLGAHYDHIGTAAHGVFCRPSPDQTEADSICNGADDNASGTAMVLEIARAFAAANYRPSRTIVFAHFAGEELGLHGSRALANEPPPVPPFREGRVVAMINLDMVGRLGEKGLAIGGIGSSPAWMEILGDLDERGMPVIYERAISGRSDHAPFYEKKVPVLFFFTGVHDDYHRAGDESAKINREGMASIAEMVTDALRKVADGHPMSFTPPRSPKEGIVPRMPGTDPSTLEHRAAQ